MRPTVKNIDLEPFNAGLRKWAAAMGKTIPAAITEQGRLLGRDLIKLTPPKSVAQGKTAIARDLYRAVAPLFDGDPQSSAMRELIAEGDLEAIGNILRRRGFEGRLEPFSDQLHSTARDSRGRVPDRTGVYTIDYAAWKRRLREVTARVGMAKGGWAALTARLGGKVPGWVSRHAAQGSARDRRSDRRRPMVEFVNHAFHIGGPHFRRLVELAIKLRVKRMRKSAEIATRRAARAGGFKS